MNGTTLLTYQQFAELLGVAEVTVRRWAAAGTVPVVRIGRACRIPASYVDELTATAVESANHKNRA